MKFTGQDIHAAFVAVHEKRNLPLVALLAEWERVRPVSRELYTKMAEYLNKQAEKEEEAQGDVATNVK